MLPEESTMNEVFVEMSNRRNVAIPRTKEFKRQQVIDAFQESFELIGGVSMLAAWAYQNQTEFYRLYAKLLPSQSLHDFGGKDGVIRVVHSIAPGPLDTAPKDLTDNKRIIEHDDRTGN